MRQRMHTFSMGEDRISTLPDEILCHILFFLPTKDAVATSVLSKRWTQLWRSVSALDFTEEDVEEEKHAVRFTEFVEYVIRSRDATQPIQRFHLETTTGFITFSNISKWLNIALQHGVEDLKVLVCDEEGHLPLPIGVLSCSSLVVLCLEGLISVEVFSSVELPSLKALRLYSVEFRDSPHFIKLLSGCPILEDLLVSYIDFESISSMEFQTLRLANLMTAYINSWFQLPLEVFYNVKFLRLDISKGYTGINDLPTFANLTHLKLYFMRYHWHFLVKVLKSCRNLQILALDELKDRRVGPVLRVDDQEIWTDPEFVPECISLCLTTCTITQYGGLKGELMLVRYILKNARVLQTMTIWSRYDSTEAEKLKMIKELSVYPRSSATCELHFVEP